MVLNAGDIVHVIDSCYPVILFQAVVAIDKAYFMMPVDIVLVGFGKKLYTDETLISETPSGINSRITKQSELNW